MLRRQTKINKLFKALSFVPQNLKVHPEGNAWNSTALAWYLSKDQNDLELTYACMFALTGKIVAVKKQKGIWIAPNYERHSCQILDDVLSHMRRGVDFTKVKYLVINHKKLRNALDLKALDTVKRIRETGEALGCYNQMVCIMNYFDSLKNNERLHSNDKANAYTEFSKFVDVMAEIERRQTLQIGYNRREPIVA